MYLPFSDLKGFRVVGREVGAADEPVALGTLDDLRVDVRDWRVGHLVLATGGPLAPRRVLLGTDRPVAFDLVRRELVTEWTPYDVDTAPEASSLRTAADAAEDDPDGEGGLMFGPGGSGGPGASTGDDGPAVLGGDPAAVSVPPTEEERHLHDARELLGYAIGGSDGEVGTVSDLLIDRESPAIAWLVVATGSWLSGRDVVLDPAWTTDASAAGRRMSVALTRERMREAPPLESLDGLDHAYGAALAAFYRFVG